MTVAQDRWTVYELINEKEREIYVDYTALPVFKLAPELAKRRPKCLNHWDLDNAMTVRSVEFDLAETDAQSFIKTYAQMPLPEGWKYLTD